MVSSQQEIDWIRKKNWRAKKLRLEIESRGLDHAVHAICWEVLESQGLGGILVGTGVKARIIKHLSSIGSI